MDRKSTHVLLSLLSLLLLDQTVSFLRFNPTTFLLFPVVFDHGSARAPFSQSIGRPFKNRTHSVTNQAPDRNSAQWVPGGLCVVDMSHLLWLINNQSSRRAAALPSPTENLSRCLQTKHQQWKTQAAAGRRANRPSLRSTEL